jgi:hypothetical protein
MEPIQHVAHDFGFTPAVIVSIFISTVFFILYVFLLGGWAYRDATFRGKPGWLVSLIVLFGAFPLGLIFWILFRPPVIRPPSNSEFDLNNFRVQ